MLLDHMNNDIQLIWKMGGGVDFQADEFRTSQPADNRTKRQGARLCKETGN